MTSNAVQNAGPRNPATILENLIIKGDLSGLNPTDRVRYYNKLCEMMGLNPLTQPFEYLTFQGKLVLYAKKGCAEQLRNQHGFSIEVVGREKLDDMYVVTVNATSRDGRKDSSTGVVAIGNLKGQELANAMMKAETKAKRRVTLSICGLNMLDESEVSDLPIGNVKPENPDDDALALLGADNDPHAEPRFTRGSFQKRKPSEVHVSALRSWVEMVEKRLADPSPKKPLSDEDRQEWERNVEMAAKHIAFMETTANMDPESFENFKDK